MANLGQQFDATQVAVNNDFGAMPDGEYPVIITGSQMKPTRRGDGKYLELTLEVIDGQYKNRKVWDRLNLANPNPKAVEIGQKQLSALCHATGKLNINDSEELHNIPVIAKIKKKPDEGWGESNDVQFYKAMNSSANQAAPSAPPPPPAQPQAASAPPWAGQPQTVEQPPF